MHDQAKLLQLQQAESSTDNSIINDFSTISASSTTSSPKNTQKSTKIRRIIIMDNFEKRPFRGHSTTNTTSSASSSSPLIFFNQATSVLTVTAFPDARQYELQRTSDKKIIETASVDETDRIQFKNNFLLRN